MRHPIPRLILPALLLATATTPAAARLNDQYVQRQTEQGWLFHIFSKKIPADRQRKNANGSAQIDYTYLQQPDSVTILATIQLDNPLTPDSLSIHSCDTTYNAPAELIYVNPAGRHYNYRLRARIPFDAWSAIYACPQPFTITFSLTGPQGPHTCSYSHPARKWPKEQQQIQRIIHLIRQNTGKELW